MHQFPICQGTTRHAGGEPQRLSANARRVNGPRGGKQRIPRFFPRRSAQPVSRPPKEPYLACQDYPGRRRPAHKKRPPQPWKGPRRPEYSNLPPTATGCVAARRARIGRALALALTDPGSRGWVGTSVGITGERLDSRKMLSRGIGSCHARPCGRIERLRPGSGQRANALTSSAELYLTRSPGAGSFVDRPTR